MSEATEQRQRELDQAFADLKANGIIRNVSLEQNDDGMLYYTMYVRVPFMKGQSDVSKGRYRMVTFLDGYIDFNDGESTIFQEDVEHSRDRVSDLWRNLINAWERYNVEALNY